jgi:hypothetical protein
MSPVFFAITLTMILIASAYARATVLRITDEALRARLGPAATVTQVR